MNHHTAFGTAGERVIIRGKVGQPGPFEEGVRLEATNCHNNRDCHYLRPSVERDFTLYCISSIPENIHRAGDISCRVPTTWFVTYRIVSFIYLSPKSPLIPEHCPLPVVDERRASVEVIMSQNLRELSVDTTEPTPCSSRSTRYLGIQTPSYPLKTAVFYIVLPEEVCLWTILMKSSSRLLQLSNRSIQGSLMHHIIRRDGQTPLALMKRKRLYAQSSCAVLNVLLWSKRLCRHEILSFSHRSCHQLLL